MAYTGQSLAEFREITKQARKLRKQRAGQDVPCVSQYELEDGGDDEEPKIENHWVNPRKTAFYIYMRYMRLSMIKREQYDILPQYLKAGWKERN